MSIITELKLVISIIAFIFLITDSVMYHVPPSRYSKYFNIIVVIIFVYGMMWMWIYEDLYNSFFL